MKLANRVNRTLIIGIVGGSLAFLACGCARGGDDAKTSGLVRSVLSNGLTVIVQPVTGTKRVGVEFIYRAGIVDEPEGRTQIAHFVEHLACKSPTETYRAGESWNLLQEKGAANAETLPTFTHYDYGVAAADLELVMKIEADRLRALRLDPDVSKREASYCYSEINNLQKMENAPVVKFATMAANQSWRFGSERANVASGLETIPAEEVAAFYRANYHPGNLVIVVSGGVSPDRVLRLVKKHFENLNLPAPPPREPVDWSSLPPVGVIAWDSSVTGVFVWFEPPADPLDQAIMSLWGNLARLHLSQDVEINAVVRFIMTPSHIWPVGRLPFFIYASVGPGYNADQVHRAISDRVEHLKQGIMESVDASQFQSLVDQLAFQSTLSQQTIAVQMQFLTEQRGMAESRAMDQILLQHSMNLGARGLFLGGDVDARLAELRLVDASRLSSLIERCLDPARRHVTIVRAAGDGR